MIKQAKGQTSSGANCFLDEDGHVKSCAYHCANRML